MLGQPMKISTRIALKQTAFYRRLYFARGKLNLLNRYVRLAGCVWIFALLNSITAVQAENWSLTDQSRVSFELKTVGLSAVRGTFNQIQSRLSFDMQMPEHAVTELVFPSSSLSLSNEALKPMIMGEDFFDAAQYKTVIFKSTEFVALSASHYRVLGDLTMRGITKPVIFDVLLTPHASNPKIMNIQASTAINRTDFGMKRAYGGVGEKVNIQLNGQWKMK